MTSPLPVRIELRLADSWGDITDFVYTRDGIEISRGRSDEASNVDPGECALTLDNRDGRFSPRNPMGPYYGQLGRNTPIRVRLGDPPAASWRWSTSGGVDHVAASTTLYGDSGLLICAWIANFIPGDYTVPASMTLDAETDAEGSTMATARQVLTSGGSTGNRSATFSEDADGYASSAIAVPGEQDAPTVEEFWDDMRFAQDVEFVTGGDTQAGWWLIAVQGWQFDYDNSMPNVPGGTTGAWTVLADSEQASGAVARVKVWARKVVEDGPQKVVFPTAGDGLRNNHARLYVLSAVPFSSPRFAGEVAAWPPRWDPSESNVYVPIEAAGILRRLGQGQAPIRSAIYRQEITGGETGVLPVAYWPCEDGENAESIASALPGADPMLISGNPDLAEFDEFASSAALPVMQNGMFSGQVDSYEDTGDTQIRWLLAIPDDGAGGDQPIITIFAPGTAHRWDVFYHDDDFGGSLSVQVYNQLGQQIHDTGPIGFEVNGKLLRVSLEIRQDGSDIHSTIATLEPGAEQGFALGFDLAGFILGLVERVQVGAGSENAVLGDTAIGHVTVRNIITALGDLGLALTAWRFERAGRRVQRLCREERIAFTADGDLDATEPLGPQDVSNLLDLLQEAAEADGGILRETREEVGLAYRTRRSLYNQGL